MKNEIAKELENKIERLENDIFYLEIINRWTVKQYELADKWYNELKALKERVQQESTQ